MATRCFKVTSYNATSSNTPGQMIQPNGVTVVTWRRANTLSSVTDVLNDSTSYYNGCLVSYLVVDGSRTNEWSAGWSFTQDDGHPSCPPDPNPGDKYDCLNGQCIKDSVYSTPGQYETLEACQAGCGSGCQPPNICVPPNHCPDGYVCIGADEFAEIKRELG